MPRYKVKEPGFFEGRIYDPNGKRRVLHADKSFPTKKGKEQVPSWLERIEEETAAQKKSRIAAEKKAAAANAKKAAEDREAIEGASFLDGPEGSSAVETL